VYALSRSRKLYALDAATGAKKWEYNTYNSVTSPTVRDGIVYFGTIDDDKLNAVDVATGLKKWDYWMFGNIYSSPTVAGGLVYTCSFPGLVLYTLDAITGVRKWSSYNSTNSTVSSPCVVMKSGKVYHSGISGAQE
jgi:serine/threonine-protein kinase